VSHPKGTRWGTSLGSFLLLSEEEQQERAQGIYDSVCRRHCAIS
jgi:hypothetical protein